MAVPQPCRYRVSAPPKGTRCNCPAVDKQYVKPSDCHVCDYREDVPKTDVTDCPHRGELRRHVKNTICGSCGENSKVYSCALHGECTLRKATHSLKSCLGCADLPGA